MSLDLVIRGGKFNGQIVRVADRVARFVVGRDPDCDLRITSKGVSRRHCLLVLEPDWVVLHDLNSANGTCVNGQRVMGPTPIARGDQIQIGPIVMEAGGEIFDRSGTETLDLMLDAGFDDTLEIGPQDARVLLPQNDDSSVGVGYERPVAWTEGMSTAKTRISRSPGVIGNKP